MTEEDMFLRKVNDVARTFPVDRFLHYLEDLPRTVWKEQERGSGKAFFTSRILPYTVSLYLNGSPIEPRMEVVGRNDEIYDIRSPQGNEFYTETCITIRGPRVRDLYESLITRSA